MHLVILSGAARPQSRSNTARVIAAFRRGFEEGGNTAEVWYLSAAGSGRLRRGPSGRMRTS